MAGKSVIRERVEALAARFVARNFESIVGKLASYSARLELLADRQEAQAATARAEAARLDAEAAALEIEAEHSLRVARKLDDILS